MSPTWRVRGTPLVAGSAGPLTRVRVAVKDVYAVAGHRIGAGNPAWLAAAPVQERHARAVQQLLDAGADVAGIVHGDELAWSLAGDNHHYGTPPNPAAPGRLPGGSSSGSGSAVALGEADVGLGTDTGGSIRVPAAYQGLYGIRTTHGAVPVDGVVPLAPSFDAVGWLTRDAGLLAAVGDVLLPPEEPGPPTEPTAPPEPPEPPELVVLPALLALADPDVADAVQALARRWGAQTDKARPDPGWLDAYRGWQSAQAWRVHGAWLTGRLDVLGPGVRGRFESAARMTPDAVAGASQHAGAARAQVRALVGDRVLVLPSASSVAPPLGSDLTAVREATLRLTCLAGLGGLPAVSVPTTTAAGLPCGVCLVAAPGRDRDLLRLAATLTRRG